MFVAVNHSAWLYKKFSHEPYVPKAYWTNCRDFKLDPLYQSAHKTYIPDAPAKPANFQIDTTLGINSQPLLTNDFQRAASILSALVNQSNLVPPPGNDPGSTDFQSAA